MIACIRPFNFLCLPHQSLKLHRKLFDWHPRIVPFIEKRIEGIALIKKLDAARPVKSVSFIKMYVVYTCVYGEGTGKT